MTPCDGQNVLYIRYTDRGRDHALLAAPSEIEAAILRHVIVLFGIRQSPGCHKPGTRAVWNPDAFARNHAQIFSYFFLWSGVPGQISLPKPVLGDASLV